MQAASILFFLASGLCAIDALDSIRKTKTGYTISICNCLWAVISAVSGLLCACAK